MEHPPRGAGAARGLTPPSHLPPVGATVVRYDNVKGVVQPYDFLSLGQMWFPAKFGHVTGRYRLAQSKRERPSSGNGVVEIVDSTVTSINRGNGASTGETGGAELASSA